MEERPHEVTGSGSHLQAERRPHQKPTLLAPGSWTPSLQNHGELHFCCLSHPASGILLRQLWQSNADV